MCNHNLFVDLNMCNMFVLHELNMCNMLFVVQPFFMELDMCNKHVFNMFFVESNMCNILFLRIIHSTNTLLLHMNIYKFKNIDGLQLSAEK